MVTNGEQENMIIITRVVPVSIKVKKVHCPVCGARLCDVKKSQQISEDFLNNDYLNGIIIKCYKCGRKFNIVTKEL